MFSSSFNRLPLASPEVDRDYLARSRPELFDELASDSAARILPLWRGRALMSDASARALALLPVHCVSDAEVRIYLGRTLSGTEAEPVGTPVTAVLLTDEVAAGLEPDESRWANLLTVGPQLSDRDSTLFTEALAIANWHDSHRYSPRNGDRMLVEQAGWVRRSAADSSEVFPRTDPAVIVRILDDDDRILLGSNAMWAGNRYSLLAGFVEPGESLEAAVIREMFEESGLRVVDPVYLGSQPWPFPASVMCGFEARLALDQPSTGINPDGEEILDLRWFSRDELRDGLADLVLPGSMSIARAIIEDWFGGPLE